MISLNYACSKCTFKTSVLTDAQDHSNDTRHHITLSGFMSPNQEPKSTVVYDPEAAHMKRAKDAAIMRAARDKGLVK